MRSASQRSRKEGSRTCGGEWASLPSSKSQAQTKRRSISSRRGSSKLSAIF
jgi:hypothetical protein